MYKKNFNFRKAWGGAMAPVAPTLEPRLVPYVKFDSYQHSIIAVTVSVNCCPSTGVHPIARDRDWRQFYALAHH